MMLNQKTIQLNNKKRLYRLISENPGISRVHLAADTYLSKTTVSAIVEQLIREEYIVDTGVSQKTVQGRRPNALAVDAEKNAVLVCNLRARVIQFALVSSAYHVESLHEIPFERSSATALFVVNETKKIIQTVPPERRINGICVIIPGIIDGKREEIVSVVLPLRDPNELINAFRQELSDEYSVAFFNDTCCFSYAEDAFSGDSHDFIYININEGVGASFIQDGNLVNGATGMGTQFGHFSIRKEGVDCICGNKGCLENYIGESVLRTRVEEFGILSEFENPDRIRFTDVGKLAESGSAGAIALINALAEDLGFGLGNLLTLFHLDKVVIGGMGRMLGKIYLDEVQRQVRRFGFRRFTQLVNIEFTNLNEDALFTGAAKFFMDHHYEFTGALESGVYL